MSILTALIGPIADVGKTFLNNRAEEKQAKHKAKMSVTPPGVGYLFIRFSPPMIP